MEPVIQQKVIEVANQVEDQLDAELEKLDKLDINDFEKLRENRLKEFKRMQQLREQWITQGHGTYVELADERELFAISKKSENIICLFFKENSPRCEIANRHLLILSKRHMEARFCKMNIERCPFFAERLRINVLPTIAIIRNTRIKNFIVGFTDLGNCDNFSTETLEYRILLTGAINGDMPNPSETVKKPWLSNMSKNKIIKGHDDDSDDD